MGIFRKSSVSSENSNGSGPKVTLTKDDVKNYKIRTGNVHDPILQAVNEAQPFEEAETSADASQFQAQHQDSQRQSYAALASNGDLLDVFGRPINRPDISNPTRSRDERPLDTIRSFEYAITGDNSFRDRLESDQLGFRPRQDFPRFGNGSNAYAMNDGQQQQPLHSFSGAQEEFEQGVYQAPAATGEKKKKKRGLFGRKKD